MDNDISFRVNILTGDSEEKVKSLRQQLSELYKEMDLLVQQNNKGEIIGLEYEERKLALQERELSILKQISEFESMKAANRDKVLQQEAATRIKIQKAQEEEIKRQESEIAKLVQGELNTLERISRARRESDIKAAFEEKAQIDSLQSQYKKLYDNVSAYINNNTTLTMRQFQQYKQQFAELEAKMKERGIVLPQQNPLSKFDTYHDYVVSNAVPLSVRVADINRRWEENFLTNYPHNMTVYAENAKKLREEAIQVTEAINKMGSAFEGLDKKANYLGSFRQKLRSHFNWILAGAAITATFALPVQYINTMAEIEKGMAGMEQVMEKPIDTVNRLKTAIEELKKAGENIDLNISVENISVQERLNKLTQDFIDIASKYGESINDVIESAKLWGRAYKDLNVVQTMVNASSKLAVADSFDMITANKALESSIMQWGFQIKNNNDALTVSNKIIDSWTNLAHNYTVSAQTLAEANERMASSAKLVGVSFDFAQALVAVMARKTQASGSEIGNALRSIFASIHTDKAIKAIQDLGVEVYKIGENGTKEFRNVEDVLVDIMLKTQDTTANLEELFKSMAGGKWQWNKMGAIIDYQEFIRALNLSINSQGMAAQQVAMQLDTIYRKVATLRAELERTATKDTGLKTLIKDTIDALTNMIKLLNNIPSETYHIMELLGGLILLSNGWRKVAEGIRMANQASSVFEAINKSGFIGALTKFTGPLNMILLTLTAINAAYGVYTALTNNAANKTDLMNQKIDSLNREYQIQQAQLENINRNIPYIDTLTNAWRTLQEQIANTDDIEKRKKLEDEQIQTEQVLTSILGQEAVERLKDSDMSIDAVQKEKIAYENSRDAIKAAMSNIREEMYNTAKDVVIYTNKQIEAIKNEAINFDAAADAIGAALGKIQQYLWEYYKGKASYFKELAKGVDKNGNVIPGDYYIGNFDQVGEDVENQYTEIANEAEEKAKEIEQKAIQHYASNPALDILNQLGETSLPTRDEGSTGTVEEKPPKETKSPESSHTGTEYQVQKNELKAKLNTYEAIARTLNNDYATALDKIKEKEDIYGQTVDTLNKRLETNSHYWEEIQKLIDDITADKNEVSSLINGQEFQTVFGISLEQYRAMSKEERAARLENIRTAREENSLLLQRIEFVNKLDELTSELIKNQQKMHHENEVIRNKTLPEYIYNKNMSDLDYAEQHEIAQLGYNATDEQKRTIELIYAREKLAVAEKRLKELESIPNDELYKKQQAEVDKLKLKIDELSNHMRDSIRQGLEGITSDILIKGNSLRQVWNKLWTSLAEDALKALFKIQNNTPSLLAQILGLFGGSTAKSSPPPKVSGDYSSLIHAKGGIANSPAIFGEDGEEVAIPVEKHTENSLALLKYAANKLGVPLGVQVIPALKNPDLANSSMLNIHVTQQENHIRELEKQTQVMQNMLQIMIANQENSNSAIAQPIIVQSRMTMDEFMNMYYQAQRFNYIK